MCVGEYICRADYLDMQTVTTLIEFCREHASDSIDVAKNICLERQVKKSISADQHLISHQRIIFYWRQASLCVTRCLLFVASAVRFS